MANFICFTVQNQKEVRASDKMWASREWNENNKEAESERKLCFFIVESSPRLLSKLKEILVVVVVFFLQSLCVLILSNQHIKCWPHFSPSTHKTDSWGQSNLLFFFFFLLFFLQTFISRSESVVSQKVVVDTEITLRIEKKKKKEKSCC